MNIITTETTRSAAAYMSSHGERLYGDPQVDEGTLEELVDWLAKQLEVTAAIKRQGVIELSFTNEAGIVTRITEVECNPDEFDELIQALSYLSTTNGSED